MRREVVEDRVDPLDLRGDPGLDLLQEVRELGGAAAAPGN
jgi:hypothetical protein